MALVNIRVLEGRSGVRHDDDAEERLASLMREYGTSLFNFLLVLTRERELALDCLQDTYARAHENLRRGKSVNQQWLYRVARNRAIDDFRRQRQVRTNVPEMEEIPMPEQGGNPRVRRVLAALSEEEREILYLFIFDSFKTAEIASMLGIGAGATRMRISRAREHFRALYGEDQ